METGKGGSGDGGEIGKNEGRRWGRGQWERGGEGEAGAGERETMRGQEEGDFIDGYDGMPGWTLAIGLINGCKQIEVLGRRRL